MPVRYSWMYIDDVLTAIKKIQRYRQGLRFEEFVKDTKTVDAVIRNLEILGEAAKNMPKSIRKAHPEIPWRKIIGMRNKVIHEYFGIDLEILWQTITVDLPILKKQFKKLWG